MPFRYQGQYEDEETGLYYNRFRYYSPESGTYISQDPIGLAGNNPNTYAYVKDVHTWVDVFGLSGLFKVFWSGSREAKGAAELYAKRSGGEVLEMTPYGKALEQFTAKKEWEEAEPYWNKTSQHFAGSAPKKQKYATVFIGDKFRGSDSVWERFEKPILEKKGIKTKEIYVNTKKKIPCQ